MASFNRQLVAEIPRLYRYARALTRDVTRADDLVQSTLARALAKRELWQPGTDLRAWLLTILHNQYVNHVRKAIREGSSIPIDAEGITVVAHQRADSALTVKEVEMALSLLPAEQREVLVLVGLEELTYERVAAFLEIPVGSVRSRLSRGRELLRMLLEGTADGEPGHTKRTLRGVAAKVAATRRYAEYL